MLALDPKYKLRRTKTNVLFYRFDEIAVDLADQKTIHPNAAILLSFFNGINDMDSIRNTAKYIFNLNGAELDKTLEEFLNQWRPFLIDADNKIRHDNPNDFIIPSNQIDLAEIICEAPMYLGLNITQKCGRNCIYCYAEREDIRRFNEMTTDQIITIINQAIDLKMEFIILSGGDPFLRSDAIEIIELISKAGMSVQLSTKQFLDNETIIRLKNAGIKTIQISIDCIDNSLSEFLIGIKDYSDKAFCTIERIQQEGIEVTTNTVVTSYVVDGIPKLVDKLVSRGVRVIRLSQYYRSAYRHDDKLFISEKQARRLMDYTEYFNKINSNNGVIVHFSSALVETSDDIDKNIKSFLNRPMCTAGRMSFVIMPNGKVIGCEQLPCRDEYILGDVTTQTICEIWNSDTIRRMVKPDKENFRNSICFGCEYYDDCIPKKGNCIRDAWKAYNTIYQIHPNCPKAATVKGIRLS